MAKKSNAYNEEPPDNTPMPGDEDLNGGVDTEFNLEDEFKPEPLFANNIYAGAITAFKYDRKNSCFTLEWTLNGNGGYCSDGETPIDGRKLWQRIWLPKPGDDVTMTASGSMTKRQSKINMMTRAFNDLKIHANTLADVLEGIANSEYIGLEGRVTTELETYEGQTSVRVKKAVAV